MKELTLEKGILSEYEESSLWVAKLETGSPAVLIEFDSKDENKKTMTPCKVVSIIKRSQYDTDKAYNEAVDRILNVTHATATGEFVTDDDIFYLEMERDGNVGDIPVEKVHLKDVVVC